MKRTFIVFRLLPIKQGRGTNAPAATTKGLFALTVWDV
jgi:hypothetical protein